jgi:NitT/TauT family transport system substrate-binding protein
VHREAGEVRIAQQFGLGYLPLMVARQHGLIEKHAARLGHRDLTVSWSRFPSGKALNDALHAGLLDVAAGGVAALIHAWERGRGHTPVRGIAALSSMPLYLVTPVERIQGLADFREGDRIAVPAVHQSHQALLLRMAAARELGPGRADALEPFLVARSHPEAVAALLAEDSGITAHFSSPPYQYQQLEVPGMRLLVSSRELAGGPATFSALWATAEFRERSPRTYRAVLEAMVEAMGMIREDPQAAAEAYQLQAGPVPVSAERVAGLLGRPEIAFTVTPERTMTYARFMAEEGRIEAAPAGWTELFFPELHGGEGS